MIMPKRIERKSLPKLGSTLEKSYKGHIYKAKVISVNESKGHVRLEVNGKKYASPSAAAKALTGSETNGWRFWGIN
jgi:hypothetical protein